MAKLTNDYRQDFKNPRVVEAVVEKAFNGKKTMATLQQDEDLLLSSQKRNEFLQQIRNQLAIIYTGHYMKIKVPLHKYFWHDAFKYGDYALIRQPEMARHDEYTEGVDVNDSYVPRVQSQMIETVFRDRYLVSISEAIVAAAFQGPQQMGEFMIEYLASLDRAHSAIWFNRNIKMLQTIPTIYKLDDATDGKVIAQKLLLLIEKMGMTSTQFNIAGLPSHTSADELIMVINSNVMSKVMFDAVGSIYNFKDIKNGGKLMEVITHDFFDDQTIAVFLTKDAFKINTRFNSNTERFFADTLRKDMYQHEWLRAGRINFANAVRVVKKSATIAPQIDYKMSPFTHYTDEYKQELIKDEAKIVDITNYIEGQKVAELSIPTGIKKFLTGMKMRIKGSGKPTKDVILKTLQEQDYRVDIKLIDVPKITEDYITLKVKYPYVVNKFTDEIKVDYVMEGGTPTPPPSGTKSTTKNTDTQKEPNNA